MSCSLWQLGMGLNWVSGYLGGKGLGWAFAVIILQLKCILSTDPVILNLYSIHVSTNIVNMVHITVKLCYKNRPLWPPWPHKLI